MLWDVDTSGWNSTLATVWNLLPLLSVVAIAIGAIYYVFKPGSATFVETKNSLKTFMLDRRGAFTAGAIIAVVITCLVFAVLIPVAVEQLTAVNGSLYSSYHTKPHYSLVINLIGYILPLIIVISLVVYMVRRMQGGGE